MNNYIVKLSIPANTIDEAHAWAYLVIRSRKTAYVIGIERDADNKRTKLEEEGMEMDND